MEKPVNKQQVDPAYDFNEVMRYIKFKYGIDHRDMAGQSKFWKETTDMFKEDTGISIYGTTLFTSPEYKKFNIWKVARGLVEPKYLDFWHWVTDNYEVADGKHITMFIDDDRNNMDIPEHVSKMYNLLEKEFERNDDDGYRFYICW